MPSREDSGRPVVGELLVVVAIVLATRWPFLSPGFGWDFDAWLVADAARTIATTGEYVASRRPGYPLVELAQSVAWRAGPVWMNAATAAMTALASAMIVLVLRRAGARSAWAPALAFAFTPIVYVASTTTMDYLWAVALGLAGLRLAQSGHGARAGVLLGLGIASRLTTALFVLPLGLLLWPRGKRPVVACLATAGGISVAAYALVLRAHGWGWFSTAYRGTRSFEAIVREAGPGTWGQIGSVGVVVLTSLLLVPRLRRDPGDGRGLLRALAVGFVAVVAAFLAMPYESGYLIPAVAFLLIAVGLLAKPPVQVAWLAVVLVSSFVALDGAAPVAGPVLRDHRVRVEEERFLERLLESGRALEHESIVLCGRWFPRVRYRLNGTRDGRARYVMSLDRARAGEHAAAGLGLVFVPGIEAWHRANVGSAPGELGAVPLRLVEPETLE